MANTVQILIDPSVQKNRFVDISENHYHLSSINKLFHAIKSSVGLQLDERV